MHEAGGSGSTYRAGSVYQRGSCRNRGAYNYPEKSRLLKHAPDVETAKFYTLEGYRNFFYGLMAPSTGYIGRFQLMKYRDGVLLRFPQPSAPDRLPGYIDDKQIYAAFEEEKEWHRLLACHICRI